MRYRVYHNVDAPTPRRSRRKKWDLPLEELQIGSKLVVEMPLPEARERIHAFRAMIDRAQKKLDWKFSVYLSDAGIEVFRRGEGDNWPVGGPHESPDEGETYVDEVEGPYREVPEVRGIVADKKEDEA